MHHVSQFDHAAHAAAKLYEIVNAVERGEIRVATPAERAMIERIDTALTAYEERARELDPRSAPRLVA